jgi:hypothetical protein
LFTAAWTIQEGGGRPLERNGNPLSSPESPLIFPRNFNRISGPDSNRAWLSQYPVVGGGGDIEANVSCSGSDSISRPSTGTRR